MKRKFAILALALCLGVSMTSCGAENSKEDTKTESTDTAAADDYNLDEVVALGEYKGIAVDKVITPVTDEDVQNEIDYALSNPVEVTDENAVAQEGDTVNIDYEGTKDGVAFDGGTAEGYDLELGSGQFIDGFEDGLIGAKKGESRDLNLKFPDDYSEESLQGADVVFHVTVNAIKRSSGELTDAWVQANTDYQMIDEYRAGIRTDLENQNQEQADQQARNTAWTQVVEGSEIKEYPESLVKQGEDTYQDQVESYAQMFGMEVEDYIEQLGMSQEEYDAQKEEYGKSITAARLVLQAIVKAEGYTVDDEDYKNRLAEYVEQQQTTEEEFLEQYGEDVVEEQIMMDRVLDLIMENAVVTEKQETEESTDTANTDTDAAAEDTQAEE